jgi:hypothetical protein
MDRASRDPSHPRRRAGGRDRFVHQADDASDFVANGVANIDGYEEPQGYLLFGGRCSLFAPPSLALEARASVFANASADRRRFSGGWSASQLQL